MIIHQVYELWFKQVLHEAALLQSRLEAGNGAAALGTARRIAKILKTVVGQLDILETMTPQQFASFRPELGSSSGFQSTQFRYLEAVLGRRDFSRSVIDQKLARDHGQASAVRLAAALPEGQRVPGAGEALGHDPALPWTGSEPPCRRRCWPSTPTRASPPRCARPSWTSTRASRSGGTGTSRWSSASSAGRRAPAAPPAEYLRSTLFRPAFPDLWEIRSRL